MEKKKANVWMIATIVFGIMIIGIVAFQVHLKNSDAYDFGNLKISKSVLSDAGKVYGSQPFIVCSVKDKLCTPAINKIG